MKKPTHQNLDDLIQQKHAKKETLAFHKMDDVSRRQFIQSIGTFLGVLSVPSIIQLETMSKISKKLFGNSLAFSQGSGATGPMNIITGFRAAYDMSWIVATDQFYTHPNHNRPWGQNLITTGGTSSGVNLNLNPHAGMFRTSGYQNSIQLIRCIESGGPHQAYFPSIYESGYGWLPCMAAKQQYDEGLGSILKAGFGFYDPTLVAINDVPANLQDFVPTQFTNIQTVLNQFTPTTFETNQGTTIPTTLMKRFVEIQEGNFAGEFAKALYQKDKDKFLNFNQESNKILLKNFRASLDLDDPSNSAAKAALTAGLPAIPFGNLGNVPVTALLESTFSVSINPVYAWFAGIQAFMLGITPAQIFCNFRTSDWHNLLQQPAGVNDTGVGDKRQTTGEYFAKLIYNFCEAANNGIFVNPTSGNNQVLHFNFATEHGRGQIVPGVDNPDGGYNDTMLFISSNKSQTERMPGSFGGWDANEEIYGFNPSNKTHSINTAMFTRRQGFEHKAKCFGVDLSAFGLSTTGIPNM